MWKGLSGLIEQVKQCETAGLTIPAIAMTYILIDTVAFLSMPASQTSQTRSDFISWVDRYVKADPSQSYQYNGRDVYAARCALLHTFSAEAELHRKDMSVKVFGYSDGGQHAHNADIHANLAVIGTSSLINDVLLGVQSFIDDCKKDGDLRARAESRLPALHQVFPFA